MLNALLPPASSHAHCSQGKYAEAEVLQVVVLAVRKRVLGEEHPSTLTSASSLAMTYSAQGKHAEAEALKVAVLAAQKRVLGDEHASTLSSANNLARTYCYQAGTPRRGRWRWRCSR